EVRLRDLGVYRLRGVEAPERLFQVEYARMEPAEFPPLRAERAHRGNLPLQVTRFFGREREIERLAALLAPANSVERSAFGVERQAASPSAQPSTLNPQ